MGQYHAIVNLDKKQYIGRGNKLPWMSVGPLSAALVLLLSDTGQVHDDITERPDWVGSWFGDRVCVTGDYSPSMELYWELIEEDGWQDIEEDVLPWVCKIFGLERD